MKPPTIAQRRKIVARAVKRLDAAAESLSELESLAISIKPDLARHMTSERKFVSGLKERANYWDSPRLWVYDE